MTAGTENSASGEGATGAWRSPPPAFVLTTGAALGAYVALDLVGSAGAAAPIVAYCTYVLAGAALGLPPFRPDRVSSRSRVFLALASLLILVGKTPELVAWTAGQAISWPALVGVRLLAVGLTAVLGWMVLRTYHERRSIART